LSKEAQNHTQTETLARKITPPAHRAYHERSPRTLLKVFQEEDSQNKSSTIGNVLLKLVLASIFEIVIEIWFWNWFLKPVLGSKK